MKKPKPYFESDQVVLYNNDCRDVLPYLAPMDLSLTDPPYGIDVNKMTLGNGVKKFDRGTDGWDSTRPDFIADVVAAGRHACIWGGNYFADQLPINNHWLIWYKAFADSVSFGQCELAWTNYGRQTRLLTHNWKQSKDHPTMKPSDVMKWSIGQAPGDCTTMVDCFMGTGNSIAAAVQCGVYAVGIDINTGFCELAKKKLEQKTLFFPG